MKKNQQHSDDALKKMRTAHRGISLAAIDVESGIVVRVFSSIRDAARITGASPNGIRRVLDGKGKTSAGYHWVMFSDDKTIDMLQDEYVGRAVKDKSKLTYVPADATKSKLSDTQIAKGNNRVVFKVDENNGEVIAVYSSVGDAARQNGLDKSGISACINRRRKYYGGYIWRDQDEYYAKLKEDEEYGIGSDTYWIRRQNP